MRFLFVILTFAILLSGCANQNINNKVYSKYGSNASDCVSEIVINEGCSHYCTNDCKEGMRLCRAYYKDSEDAKAISQFRCFWNEPCKEPSSVQYINNVCVVS